ncbi:MAG: hypothetical protein GX971_13220 [Firmicutes bacterium]|nr:hypothetical protein [Bacillota bacterium]
MKKFLSMSLVVVMVLALGSIAFAGEGTLAGGNTLTAEIPVNAKIGPYASLRAGGPVQFGTLLGKVGLYTANGFDNNGVNEFYHRAADIFGLEYDAFVTNNNGWGSFYVESNTDVNVALSFNNTGWLESPTLFAAAKQGAPGTPLAWASSNFALGGLPTFFVHEYQKGEILYGLDGAIWIQEISQQFAQEYSGTITVTVSK